MSSGISFSSFNGIDFNVILNAEMAAASQPLTALQTRQSDLKSKVSNFQSLASYVSAFQSAADALSESSDLSSFDVSNTDTSAVSATSTSSSIAGHYDVVVRELARAQVTASDSTAPDANTTAVATGGTLTIGTTEVLVTGAMTLNQLADTINDTEDVGVTASVIQSGVAEYRLVLTASSAGSASAFTLTNELTGGLGVTFIDTDTDGVSGDSAADNAVQATDALVSINNIDVTSTSNTLTEGIPGTTLTLHKKDENATIGIDITADNSAAKSKVNTFISSYNALVSFVSAQRTAAANGDATSIGREPTLRALQSTIRSMLTEEYTNTGAYSYLSQAGIEFTQTGTMKLNATTFATATASGTGDIAKLFAGTDGAFTAISTQVEQYTQTAGLLDSVKTQLNSQISRMDSQISNMYARLLIQRAALQAQYTAAEQAMTQLKSQSGSLSNFGTSLSSAIG